MRRSHFAVAALVALLVLMLPQGASAKGLEPLRVVTLSGKVGWIRGASADAWWKDFAAGHAADCACRTATDAATFSYRLARRWGSRPGGVLLVESVGSPMLYYPATGTAPPYLLVPGGLGVRHFQWDDWRVVTPRMQRIMAAALKDGTVSTYTGSSAAFPTGWAVGGGLGAFLLTALTLGVRRHPRVLGA